MAENQTPTTKPKRRRRKWWGAAEAVLDSFADGSLTPLKEYIKQEWRHFKNVLDLMVLFVLLGVLAGFMLRGCEVSVANNKLADVKDQLRDMTAERNKEQTRLAPFLAAGDKFFTNNPANERLSLLLETVTATLQRSPVFSFFLNDLPITNGAYITIPTTNTSQALTFAVLNIGNVAADGLTFMFSAPLELSLYSFEWDTNASIVQRNFSKLQKAQSAAVYQVHDFIMPTNNIHTLPPITIQSTNLSKTDNRIMFGVTSKNSSTFTIIFWIHFKNEVGEAYLGY